MSITDKDNKLEQTSRKAYESPNLTDYGKMSELTQTIMGDTGDDAGGVPSSYTASLFP